MLWNPSGLASSLVRASRAIGATTEIAGEIQRLNNESPRNSCELRGLSFLRAETERDSRISEPYAVLLLPWVMRHFESQQKCFLHFLRKHSIMTNPFCFCVKHCPVVLLIIRDLKRITANHDFCWSDHIS